jgi:DNA-damage-inducible protein J
MMKTIQVRVEDATKAAADALFASLGLDTSTAVRMFLTASIDHRGIPFTIQKDQPSAELLKAIDEVRHRRNLKGPFKSASEAVASMDA